MAPTVAEENELSRSILAGAKLAHPEPGEEVVITGLSGRFPDSDDVYEFRDKLFNKVDLVSDDGRRWKLGQLERTIVAFFLRKDRFLIITTISFQIILKSLKEPERLIWSPNSMHRFSVSITNKHTPWIPCVGCYWKEHMKPSWMQVCKIIKKQELPGQVYHHWIRQYPLIILRHPEIPRYFPWKLPRNTTLNLHHSNR